jgi:hypothetical protein
MISARAAPRAAGDAGIGFAPGTRPDAVRAVAVLAVAAASGAVEADLGSAAFTQHAGVAGDRRPAFGTGDPEPVVERDVGTLRVVGLQDLPHEHAAVEQPSGLQCLTDGRLAFAQTQRLTLHVRVSRVVVARRRMLLDRDDFEG